MTDERHVQTVGGRSGGSGQYSYREAQVGHHRVRVAHMPEDDFRVRVTYFHQGESSGTFKLQLDTAHALWAALNAMARDLRWSDRIRGEESDEVRRG